MSLTSNIVFDQEWKEYENRQKNKICCYCHKKIRFWQSTIYFMPTIGLTHYECGWQFTPEGNCASYNLKSEIHFKLT